MRWLLESAEAIPLAQRELTIDEKALGPDRPEVATLLNSLGELYRAKVAMPMPSRWTRAPW
jgi:hypothetical protein